MTHKTVCGCKLLLEFASGGTATEPKRVCVCVRREAGMSRFLEYVAYKYSLYG